MLDFDVICNMDWLHVCFASIDCITTVVKFKFPIEPIFEWNGGNYIPRDHIISCLKACLMNSKGCSYKKVSVQYLDSENPPI